MSPEYALKGHFSVKSDVFSFGVMLLEIVNGHKNWGFYHSDHDLNLLGHVSSSCHGIILTLEGKILGLNSITMTDPLIVLYPFRHGNYGVKDAHLIFWMK